MTPEFINPLAGTWVITRARDNVNPVESTTLEISEDPAGGQLLDGLSPVTGGGDLVFTGTANGEARSWSGLVAAPGTGQVGFMLTVDEEGTHLGGWVIDPTNGQMTAWAGKRP